MYDIFDDKSKFKKTGLKIFTYLDKQFENLNNVSEYFIFKFTKKLFF